MAFRRFVQRQGTLAVSGLLAGGTIFSMPRHTAYAEGKDDTSTSTSSSIASSQSLRKPIYDEPDQASPAPPERAPAEVPDDSSSNTPRARRSPTDRLAAHVKTARLELYKYASQTEDKVNESLSKFFDLEHSFTSTIAGLAPPKSSEERVVPGLLCVVVASMAASIATRNRGAFIRTLTPAAVGLATAAAVLPQTMQNVEGLLLRTEERISPELRQKHEEAKERVSRFVHTGLDHSRMSVDIVEGKIGQIRRSIEEWVREGR